MLIAYDETSGRFFWRVNLEVIEDQINELMHFPIDYENATTNVDTLFIAGEKSNYIKYYKNLSIKSFLLDMYYFSNESIPIMRRLFPSHRLIRIPKAGHWVHSERPYDFLNCVLPELEI